MSYDPTPEDIAAAQPGRRGAPRIPEIHRLLPQAADAERGLLSSFLINPGEIGELCLGRQIKSEHFHLPAHQVVYDVLLDMHQGRAPIDMITLTQQLRDRQALEHAGGSAYIAELYTFLPTAANAAHYLGILVEKYTLRETIKLCTGIASRCYEEQDEVPNLVEELVTRSVEIAAGGSAEETIHPVGKFAAAALDEIEYAYDNRGRTVGIPTGFADFDRMTGGWQKGYTYYFGARPAMGKSSLGLNFAANTAAHTLANGCPVLFFSVEMTGVQLTKRLIFTLAELNQQRARDGFLAESDFGKLARAGQDIVRSKLFIDETAALTIADFRARTRRWLKKMRRTHGPRHDGKPEAMVWIDYLQRMKGSSKRSEDARYLELQEIAQGISMTAKELEIPIGVLAQLKRPRDKKPDTEPDMTEFRECGDIEQEAHVVALIHRPAYYVKHSEEKQEALAENLTKQFGRDPGKNPVTVDEAKRYAKLIIDKQREGPVGPIDLRFIADYTKFETWDPNRRTYSNNAEQRQQPHLPEGEEE
jgi:replicative DNA helicase